MVVKKIMLVFQLDCIKAAESYSAPVVKVSTAHVRNYKISHTIKSEPFVPFSCVCEFHRNC